MDYKHEFARWSSYEGLDKELAEELQDLSDNEIRERFSTELSFGTAGLRGLMGAGSGRMNIHTVSRTVQGIANAANEIGVGERGVVIGYDCRINSQRFAHAAASILAANKIKVYCFDAMRPTPEISFALLQLGCAFGINITASHNPKEYNGLKVYGENGAQINDDMVAKISKSIRNIDIFDGIKTDTFEAGIQNGYIEIIGESIDDAYIRAVMDISIKNDTSEAGKIKIVYTPFHGAGIEFVPKVLHKAGFEKLFCVEEQMIPDGSFPTVKSPNPEEPGSFKLALSLAESKKADLVIGTDPDADRVGVFSYDSGKYVQITGNQVGILLTDYIINMRRALGTLPPKPAIVSTIVTSLMAKKVSEANGAHYGEAFTGFRFIAEIIEGLEKEGFSALMGFEESYGYLIGRHCNDKDGIAASLLIAEMGAHYKAQGKSLVMALDELFERYGYYAEQTLNLSFPGVDGIKAMKNLMLELRKNTPTNIGGTDVSAMRDYLTGIRQSVDGQEETLLLKDSDVLYFELDDGNSIIIRPSGTEPKVKIYILVRGNDELQVNEMLEKYEEASKCLVS